MINELTIYEWPALGTLDFAFYIGSTSTFLYFDLYLNIRPTQLTTLI